MYSQRSINEYRLKLLSQTNLVDVYDEFYRALYQKEPEGGEWRV